MVSIGETPTLGSCDSEAYDLVGSTSLERNRLTYLAILRMIKILT